MAQPSTHEKTEEMELVLTVYVYLHTQGTPVYYRTPDMGETLLPLAEGASGIWCQSGYYQSDLT